MSRPLGITSLQILAAIRDGNAYGLDLVARTGLASPRWMARKSVPGQRTVRSAASARPGATWQRNAASHTA